MFAHACNDASRISDIVTALGQHEITLGEFSDLIDFLSPEEMLIAASLLRDWESERYLEEPLASARMMCKRLAAEHRCLC